MGQPRSSRRKVVTISSDEDEDPENQELSSESSDEEEEPVKPQKRTTTGKLKSVKDSRKKPQPTSAASTQDASSQKSPSKSKVSKTKSKTAVKDQQPKPNSKPIYSFFNATTQRLQNSQPSASPEKPATKQVEEPEAIHDDTDDDEGSRLHLTQGSSTALAVRKRKAHDVSNFENEASLPPPASQKFRKATNGDRVPSFSIQNEDKTPWTHQFPPKDLTELAVHKRKVADVRQWLEMTLHGSRQRVLVLKGAAGTGKTTTIRLLAKDLGLVITEWKNPDGGEFSAEGGVSAAVQFEYFVGRGGKGAGGLKVVRGGEDYDDLYANASMPKESSGSEGKGQLLLIEEFPNTFSRTSTTLQSFRSTIAQYISHPTLSRGTKPTPLVMVISETLLSTNTAFADSFTAHRLLGPELSNHPFVSSIEFNAVAPTYLLKALDTVVLKEARKSGRRKTPGPLVLKRLAESGDIRSAVSSLEFLCLRGDDEGEGIWSSKVSFTKQKKSKSDPPLTQAEEEALKLISNRESTLGIFHAVGKVVYNKRVEPSHSIPHPPSWLPQHRRNRIPENDVEELIDELGTDTSTFVAALHENYTLSCSAGGTSEVLASLTGCIDSLSDADLLSFDRFSYGTRAFSGSATDSLRMDEMAFQVGVRGLWFCLPSPVRRSAPPPPQMGVGKRDANQMFYPVSLRLWKRREEVEGVLNVLTAKFQSGESVEFSRYEKKISKANNESELPIRGGVEGWKRNTTVDAAPIPNEQNLVGTGAVMVNSAKMEMLLERLPYIVQISDAKKVSPKLIEQLHTVTRVRDTRRDADDEDEGEHDEEDTAIAPEQWTTDRPDGESTPQKSGKGKGKSKPGSAKFSEGSGSGLGIPVERRVDKLVLEDDDIVDD